MAVHRLYRGFAALLFGEGALYQFGHSVAYQHRVDAERMGLESHRAEGVICGPGKIADGVEQGAVEVEYDKSFHMSECYFKKCP